MKKFRENFIYYFMVIFPIVDILSSFNNRYDLLPFSPGIIVRGFVLLCAIIYIFTNKDIDVEKRNKYLKYFILFISFSAVFLIVRLIDGFTIRDVLLEVVAFSKFWYFPILIIFMDSFKFDNEKLATSLKISTVLYTAGIIIPMLTDTSFDSYISDYDGIVGWFYSANEIGSLLAINSILLYLHLKINNDKKYIYLILINNFCLSLIGTKVSLFSTLIINVLVLILFITMKGIKSKEAKYASIILGVTLIFLLFNNTSYDILDRLNIHIPFLRRKGPRHEVRLLSGRDEMVKQAYAKYKKAGVLNQLFGIGILDDNIFRTVEMDMFDILFGYGIIGFIIYFIPLLYYVIAVFKKTIKLTLHNIICFIGVGLLLSIAFLAGHTISAPAVSLNIALTLGLIKKQFSK